MINLQHILGIKHFIMFKYMIRIRFIVNGKYNISKSNCIKILRNINKMLNLIYLKFLFNPLLFNKYVKRRF